MSINIEKDALFFISQQKKKSHKTIPLIHKNREQWIIHRSESLLQKNQMGTPKTHFRTET